MQNAVPKREHDMTHQFTHRTVHKHEAIPRLLSRLNLPMDTDEWQMMNAIMDRVEELEALGTENPGGVETDTRPNGFYWVQLHGDWEPAEWDEVAGYWDVIGSLRDWKDDEFDAIGSRIPES